MSTLLLIYFVSCKGCTPTINPHINSLPEELIPIFALYREAKNNYSHFYRFLCYYKILEGIFKDIRPKYFKKLRKQKIEIIKYEETVPEHFDIEHKELIGKSIQNVFENFLTTKYRNAVAHFVLKNNQVLNVSEFHSNNEFNSVLLLTELCVRKVIENQINYFKLRAS